MAAPPFTPPSSLPNITACQAPGLGPLDRFLCIQKALGSNYSSCTTGFPATPLTNTPDCAPGLYCPNLNASNELTWPQYCPPTIDCQFARLEGQWCEPQGIFEPEVCRGGRYCPNASASLECPSGAYCARGSTAPRQCEALSLCPAGSQTPTFYGGALVAAVIDVLLLAVFLYMRCVLEPRQRKENALARRRELVRAADLLVPGVAVALAAAEAAGPAKGAPSPSSSSSSSFSAAATAAAEAAASGKRGTWASAGGETVVAQNPLRAAFLGAGSAESEGADDLASAEFAAPPASGWAGLLESARSLFVPLPAGVVRDRRGRVRTKSMRRSSGTGPLFHGLDPGGGYSGGDEGERAGVGGAGSPAAVSRASRVMRMAIDAQPADEQAAPPQAGLSTPSPMLRRSLTGARSFLGLPGGLGPSPGPGLGLGALPSFSARSAPPPPPAANPLDRLVQSSATLVLEDGFRRCNASLRLGIDFRGLRLTLPPPLSKTILSSVTGRISPGRVTAVMGPSGAGKTTFLSVLMGKVARTAGTLHVNGMQDEMSAFRRVTGFVPQEDTMMRELTVRENIAHSARVRLPRHGGWDAASVDRLVDAVIEVLGLHSCADTPADRIS